MPSYIDSILTQSLFVVRRLALPKAVKDWSLLSLQAKLTKMGGRMVRQARRIIFQLSEVAVPGERIT